MNFEDNLILFSNKLRFLSFISSLNLQLVSLFLFFFLAENVRKYGVYMKYGNT